MSSNDTTLNFVKGDEFDVKSLQDIFVKVKSKGLDAELVSAKKLLEKGVDEDKILFVTGEFSGDVFELLLAHKKRIFGPICVLQCLENEVPLPNKLHPVYCLAMTGAIVSCTNIAKPLREKLKQLIERMNGVFARDFTSEVTHLIAGEVGSAKYAIAARLKKPIVLPSWVEEAWQHIENEHQFDAMDAKFVDKHRCPILKGCSMCVSGLDARRKEEIKRLVEKHGGIYLANLELKNTTHLIIEKPTGQKYDFALRWSVHCVQPDWLYDSINAGCWIDERPYLVKRDGDLNSTSKSNGTLSVTTVDATMNNTTVTSKEVSRKAAQAAKQSAESYGSKDVADESRRLSLKTIQTSGLRTIHKSKNAANKDAQCDYNVPIPSGEQFLDGCRLYLTGFNQEQLDYLQKIINAGGATRFNQVNPSVSHIVVGDKPIQDIEKLLNSEFSPYVVTVQWLLESCRQVKCLSEQEYYCFESNDVFEEEGKPNEKNNNKEVPEKIVDNENDEILRQYLVMMPNNNQPSTGQDLPTENDMDTNDGGCADNEPDETAENNLDDDNPEANKITERNYQGNVSTDKSRDEQDVLNLDGLKFRLEGFMEAEQTQLQEDIESCGGNVLSNESNIIADFLVVPLNYEYEENRVMTAVTICWFQRCVECGYVLDPDSEFLFTPFSLPDDVLPLQDCVISVSQYTGAEREQLMHLIEVLGGHFQEYFSRATRTNILANTHLILKDPLGNKYQAAVNWGIPAVKAEWLYECTRTGSKVSETSYLLSAETSPKEKGQTGLETGETGEEQRQTNSVFNEFTVPQGKGIKEIGTDNVETGDKSEAPLNNQKTKDRGVTSSSNRQPIILKVPPFFGKPQRPSFDLTDALEYLQSPCTSSGSSSAHSRLSRGSRNSFVMDDYIQEQLQAALKNSGNLLESRTGGHEGSTVDKEESTVDKENATVDKEGSTVDKEGSAIGKEDYQKENKSNEPSFLRGVVLAVSKKCAKQSSDISNMAISVGAQYKGNLDKTCTHYIHEGRLTKDQRKTKGVHVVSPHWLYDCIEQERRLDESLYPSNYNPKLALSVVKTRRSTRSTKDIEEDTSVHTSKSKTEMRDNASADSQNKEEIDQEQGGASPAADEHTTDFPMDDLKPSELEALEAISQSSAQSDSLRTREEIKQIHDLMESMKNTRRRSSRLHNSSRNSSESNETKNPRRSSSRLRSLRSNKDNSDEDDDNDQTLEDEITYDDPKSRYERQKIIAQLENCSPNVNKEPNFENIADEQANSSARKDDSSHQRSAIKKEPISPTSPLHSSTPTAPSIALHITSKSNLPEPVSLLDPAEEIVQVKEKSPPKFTLSTMSQQEKIDYGALIEDLGGMVCDNLFFNPLSRHTIAGQLNRNEKCLSSIAAGNWLLRKSYLEACRKAGCFVDEEPHEWGVGIPGESLTSLAVASRRWRTELEQKSERHGKKVGAFQDWKVLLCVEENKAGSFTRMLEAGGAKVLGSTPPFQNITHATHALISPSATLVNKIDFDRLEQAGIMVLRTEYIVDYLTATNLSPDSSRYSYRPASSNMTSRKRKQRESSFPETPGKKKRAN